MCLNLANQMPRSGTLSLEWMVRFMLLAGEVLRAHGRWKWMWSWKWRVGPSNSGSSTGIRLLLWLDVDCLVFWPPIVSACFSEPLSSVVPLIGS